MNSSKVFFLPPQRILHCSKDALTGDFGWFLQALLASLAFTCLIAKRFCEPRHRRRSWLIWFYDTSKQGMGAVAIHFANVWLSGQYKGDPCTWYLINFLLDSSVGLLIIFIGIRFCQFLAECKRWSAIDFGAYGTPPSVYAWLAQCCLYVGLMAIVKVLITLFMQLDFWESVKDFILSPINSPKVELVLVMLIIPLFINILMFWVTDNFLMHKQSSHKWQSDEVEETFRSRSKIKYKSITRKTENSESEVLLSGDDELLDPALTPATKLIT